METKLELQEYEPLAVVCKALSHPARIAILQTLAQRGTCICGEIVAAMPLSQATVSQHLKVLKEAGLIRGETEGPRSCYCIDAQTMAALRERFTGLFGALETCCQE
jgi:ArsR family transcriptional regulator